MARRVCRIAGVVLTLLYAVALLVFLLGTFGWFGVTTDPLSGVFLIPLGLPWNRLVDTFPEATWPWLTAAAPLVNIALLRLVCAAASSPGRR